MASTNAALFSVNIVCLWLCGKMYWKPKSPLLSYLWPLFDRGCHEEHVPVANKCCKVARQFSLFEIYVCVFSLSVPGIRWSGLSILPLWDQRHRAHHCGSLWPTKWGCQVLLPGPAQLPHAGAGWWRRPRGLPGNEWTGQHQEGKLLIFWWVGERLKKSDLSFICFSKAVVINCLRIVLNNKALIQSWNSASTSEKVT